MHLLLLGVCWVRWFRENYRDYFARWHCWPVKRKKAPFFIVYFTVLVHVCLVVPLSYYEKLVVVFESFLIWILHCQHSSSRYLLFNKIAISINLRFNFIILTTFKLRLLKLRINPHASGCCLQTTTLLIISITITMIIMIIQCFLVSWCLFHRYTCDNRINFSLKQLCCIVGVNSTQHMFVLFSYWN